MASARQQGAQARTRTMILVGLPGSGKSTWAREYQQRRNHIPGRAVVRLHDLDDLMRRAGTEQERVLRRELQNAVRRYPEHILDGLVLTRTEQAFLTRTCADFADEIEFHVWRENRQACLWNDRYRRKTPARETILKAPFEAPDLKALRAIFPNVTIVYHDVVRGPAIDRVVSRRGGSPVHRRDLPDHGRGAASIL